MIYFMKRFKCEILLFNKFSKFVTLRWCAVLPLPTIAGTSFSHLILYLKKKKTFLTRCSSLLNVQRVSSFF